MFAGISIECTECSRRYSIGVGYGAVSATLLFRLPFLPISRCRFYVGGVYGSIGTNLCSPRQIRSEQGSWHPIRAFISTGSWPISHLGDESSAAPLLHKCGHRQSRQDRKKQTQNPENSAAEPANLGTRAHRLGVRPLRSFQPQPHSRHCRNPRIKHELLLRFAVGSAPQCCCLDWR